MKIYSRVRLPSDGYQSEGIPRGRIGYIIEVYPDGDYEVEFSDATGITTAQIVAREEELQLAEPISTAPTRKVPANTI